MAEMSSARKSGLISFAVVRHSVVAGTPFAYRASCQKSFNGRGSGPLTPLSGTPIRQKMAECELALRRESEVLGLGCLAVLGLCSRLRLFLSFRCKFLCHGLLQLLGIHPIAFGGIHENVVAADILDLLKPYDADSMRRYRVSARVNSAQNDDPACAEEYVPETLF